MVLFFHSKNGNTHRSRSFNFFKSLTVSFSVRYFQDTQFFCISVNILQNKVLRDWYQTNFLYIRKQTTYYRRVHLGVGRAVLLVVAELLAARLLGVLVGGLEGLLKVSFAYKISYRLIPQSFLFFRLSEIPGPSQK